jgi:hypothetical protein
MRLTGKLGEGGRDEPSLALEQRAQKQRHRQSATLTQGPHELAELFVLAIGGNRGERRIARLDCDSFGPLIAKLPR